MRTQFQRSMVASQPTPSLASDCVCTCDNSIRLARNEPTSATITGLWLFSFSMLRPNTAVMMAAASGSDGIRINRNGREPDINISLDRVLLYGVSLDRDSSALGFS